MSYQVKVYNCPCCGADLLDWRHFNQAILKSCDGNDFECTGRLCGKRWKEGEILQREEPRGNAAQSD